jgi:hypothetical protein
MRRRLLPMFLLLNLLAAVPATGAVAAEPVISILNTEALEVSGEQGQSTVEAKFSVMNTSGRTVRPLATFQAASDERVNVRSVTPKRVKPRDTRIMTVTLGPVDDLSETVTGQIVVDDGTALVAQSVAIAPPPPDEPWPATLILASVAVAGAAAGWVLFELKRKDNSPDLGDPVPDPEWSFSSWATTLTALGAGFGVVLTAVTYPSVPGHVGKEELVNLNILFGLILLSAPFVFEALRKFTPAEKANKPKRRGTKGLLLFASSLTLWAVVGEVLALGLLGFELVDGDSAWVAPVAAVGFVALAIKYFIATTRQQIEMDWKAAPVATRPRPGGAPARPRSWSLL